MIGAPGTTAVVSVITTAPLGVLVRTSLATSDAGRCADEGSMTGGRGHTARVAVIAPEPGFARGDAGYGADEGSMTGGRGHAAQVAVIATATGDAVCCADEGSR